MNILDQIITLPSPHSVALFACSHQVGGGFLLMFCEMLQKCEKVVLCVPPNREILEAALDAGRYETCLQLYYEGFSYL